MLNIQQIVSSIQWLKSEAEANKSLEIVPEHIKQRLEAVISHLDQAYEVMAGDQPDGDAGEGEYIDINAII